jgi:hypothetical protein
VGVACIATPVPLSPIRGWKTAAIRVRGLGFRKRFKFHQTGARKGLSFLSDLCLVFSLETLHVGFF